MTEVIGNTPTPSTPSAITTLGSNLSNSALSLTANGTAPTSLQGGNFRILIDDEWLLVTAGQSGTTWTITRGVEGSSAASHNTGASIYHVWTSGGLSNTFDAYGSGTTAQSNAESFATSAVATETSNRESAQALLAPLANPALTGTPTAPTAASGINNTQIATTAFANTASSNVLTTVANQYAPINNPHFTGIPTAPTAANTINNTQLATTAYVNNVISGGTVLPSGVVLQVPDAFSGAVLDLYTLYVEEYGTNVGQGGNDTAAFQAAVDDAVKRAGNQEVAYAMAIRLPPVLNLNSAPRHDRQGNAIVALPEYGSSIAYLKLIGAPGGTTIFTSVSGVAYSASYGPPSILGGPTTEQLGENFNFGPFIEATDITFIPTVANPTISCFDLSRMNGIYIDKIFAVGSSYVSSVQPTHYTFGIRLPEGGNSGSLHVGSIGATCYYAGIVMNTAHVAAQQMELNYCYVGLAITGDTQYNTTEPDGHSSVIDYLLTQECTNHIGSWSATSGVISLPSGHPARVVISMWDAEDGVSDNWWSVSQNLLDANNELYGNANWNENSGAGAIFSGGNNFLINAVQLTEWINLGLGTNIEAAAASNGTPGIRLISNLFYFRGTLEATGLITAGSTIATLPEGYVPYVGTVILPLASSVGGYLTLNTSGQLACSVNLANTNLIGLDNLFWVAY